MRVLGVIGAMISLVFATGTLVATTSNDHLVRPNSDRDWTIPGYGSLLQKKLFLSPASYGRILVLPSAGSVGEYAFSIYRVTNEPAAKIAYTKASRNAWAYLSQQRFGPPRGAYPQEPWEDAPLRFNRVDVTLPVSAATALRGALAEMLRHTSGESRALVLDGTDVECSLAEHGKTITGVIPAGPAGRNVSELRELVYSLKTYCEAAGPQRQKLVTEIERKARRLVARAKQA